MDLTLDQAAGSSDKVGALQQMLMARAQGTPAKTAQPQAANPMAPGAVQEKLQQLMLSRLHTPEQMEELDQQRMSGLQQYQAALMAPSTSLTASEIGANQWVKNMGKMSPWAALTSGIGAGQDALRASQAEQRNGNILAAKVGYDDASAREKLDMGELAAIKSLGASRGAGGVEKVLPLYGRLFNSFSQQAKDMQFSEPAERTMWIRNRTDEAIASALEQFGASANPAVLQQLHAAVSTTTGSPFASTATVEPPTPSQPTSNSKPSASLPGTVQDVISPKTQIARDGEATRIRVGEQDGNLPAWPAMPGEPSATITPMSPAARSKFAQGTPPGMPPFTNKPNEAMMKAGAVGMGTEYAKEYATINEQAAAAKEQYDAYSNLEKVDPNTNAFANVQGYVGTALQGLGVDANSPIIQDAMKNRQANVLISQMSNAALRGEKGIQTRSDEVRIGNELARTTDPKQVWNYLIQLGKERAARKMELGDFAGKSAEANNGVPIAARQKYINSTRDDPLTQEFGGKLIFRSPTIAAFMRKYPDADQQEAVDYWRGLEKSWAGRQGRK